MAKDATATSCRFIMFRCFLCIKVRSYVFIMFMSTTGCSMWLPRLRHAHSYGHPMRFLGSQTRTPLSRYTGHRPSRWTPDPAQNMHQPVVCRSDNQTFCRRRLRFLNPKSLDRLFGHRKQCPIPHYGSPPVCPHVDLTRYTYVTEGLLGMLHSLWNPAPSTEGSKSILQIDRNSGTCSASTSR